MIYSKYHLEAFVPNQVRVEKYKETERHKADNITMQLKVKNLGTFQTGFPFKNG